MAQPNTQKLSDLSTTVDALLETRFLSKLRRNLIVTPFGMPKTVNRTQGDRVTWTRFTDFSVDTTALTEGDTPDGQTLANAQVTATLAGYGNYVMISDFLDVAHITDIDVEVTDMLAYQAALSMDRLAVDELQANGTQRYADAANNSTKANVESGTDVLRSNELKIVLEALRVADVPTFDDGKYKGLINPLMEADLLDETAASTFIVLAANTSDEVAKTGSIGTAFGIDLIRSNNIVADSTSTNTYGNIFLGKDAFGNVDLQSLGLQMIRKPQGSAGSEDPLNQRASIGYKFYYVAKILQALRAQILWAYGA